jgi:hypothetical protein
MCGQAGRWTGRRLSEQAGRCVYRQTVVWTGSCCVDRQVFVRTDRKMFGKVGRRVDRQAYVRTLLRTNRQVCLQAGQCEQAGRCVDR